MKVLDEMERMIAGPDEWTAAAWVEDACDLIPALIALARATKAYREAEAYCIDADPEAESWATRNRDAKRAVLDEALAALDEKG